MKLYDVRECGSSSTYSSGGAQHSVTIGIEVPRDQKDDVIEELQLLAAKLRFIASAQVQGQDGGKP